MKEMICFFAGLFLGGAVGFITLALLQANRLHERRDD